MLKLIIQTRIDGAVKPLQAGKSVNEIKKNRIFAKNDIYRKNAD